MYGFLAASCAVENWLLADPASFGQVDAKLAPHFRCGCLWAVNKTCQQCHMHSEQMDECDEEEDNVEEQDWEEGEEEEMEREEMEG